MRGRERSQLRTEALRRGTAKLFSTQGLGCSAAAKTCLITSCICLFVEMLFCCCGCLILFCFPSTTGHRNTRSTSDKAMHFIPCSSQQIKGTLLKKRRMTNIVWLQVRSVQQKCGATVCLCVCMTVLLPLRLAFVRAQSLDTICSFLLLTMRCRFEATGPIWGLLSNAWAQHMHYSGFWVDLTWAWKGKNEKNK